MRYKFEVIRGDTIEGLRTMDCHEFTYKDLQTGDCIRTKIPIEYPLSEMLLLARFMKKKLKGAKK